jgi:hypothetical protein
MTRTLEQDQAALGRNERLPEPPFEPSCQEVHDRYKIIFTTMPESLWHLQSLRSLALQVAECEVTLARMHKEMVGQSFIDWEGKPNPLVGMITRQQTILGNLLVKLRALPEQADIDGMARKTSDEIKANQTLTTVQSSPIASLNLIAKNG